MKYINESKGKLGENHLNLFEETVKATCGREGDNLRHDIARYIRVHKTRGTVFEDWDYVTDEISLTPLSVSFAILMHHYPGSSINFTQLSEGEQKEIVNGLLEIHKKLPHFFFLPELMGILPKIFSMVENITPKEILGNVQANLDVFKEMFAKIFRDKQLTNDFNKKIK